MSGKRYPESSKQFQTGLAKSGWTTLNYLNHLLECNFTKVTNPKIIEVSLKFTDIKFTILHKVQGHIAQLLELDNFRKYI